MTFNLDSENFCRASTAIHPPLLVGKTLPLEVALHPPLCICDAVLAGIEEVQGIARKT